MSLKDKPNKNAEDLVDFIIYCMKHQDSTFWECLEDWYITKNI